MRRADANIDTEPRTKPKPGPSTRPDSTIRKNIGSSPAVPAPSGRSAAPAAASTPSSATDFASRPTSPPPAERPSDIWAITTASSNGSSRANSQGASAEWLTSADEPDASSGQPKAATPIAEISTRAVTERRPSGTGRARFGTVMRRCPVRR